MRVLWSLLGCLVATTRSKIATHMIADNTEWVYVDKFCFDEIGGILEFLPVLSVPDEDTLILFYADYGNQWSDVYAQGSRADVSCEAKVKAASLALGALKYSSTATALSVTGNKPRWWYVAVANCRKPTAGVHLRLELTFMNGFTLRESDNYVDLSEDVSMYVQHFGENEQGILQMSIFFTVFYTVMFVLVWRFVWVAKQKNMASGPLKSMRLAFTIFFLARLLEMFYYLEVGRTGLHNRVVEICSGVLRIWAELLLLLVILKTCQGLHISTNYIIGNRLLILAVVAFAFVNGQLFLSERLLVDKASTVFEYESVPGVLMLLMRVLLLVYAIHSLIATKRMESDQQRVRFYNFFMGFVVFWFLSLPVTVLVAFGIDSWDRRKLVYGFESTLQSAAFLLLACMFRPYRGNRIVKILAPDDSVPYAGNLAQVFPGQLSALDAVALQMFPAGPACLDRV